MHAGVTFDANGAPRAEEVEKAVQSVVMLRIRLCCGTTGKRPPSSTPSQSDRRDAEAVHELDTNTRMARGHSCIREPFVDGLLINDSLRFF
jgi:hypothetical protein